MSRDPFSTSSLDLLSRTPTVFAPKLRDPYAEQAELYMAGLMSQVREREDALQSDEELAMICWQGQEKFLVRSVKMPSHNVVALHCLDGDGATVQITGHMHAITFSFRVSKIIAPAKFKRIGFELPA